MVCLFRSKKQIAHYVNYSQAVVLNAMCSERCFALILINVYNAWWYGYSVP